MDQRSHVRKTHPFLSTIGAKVDALKRSSASAGDNTSERIQATGEELHQNLQPEMKRRRQWRPSHSGRSSTRRRNQRPPLEP
ncbi:hypothetical protein SRHO_G00291320 [Serrasalmus rhombeus]